jgi:hypothetical protein
MFEPTHLIRWKVDIEVEVLTQWSQETGACYGHMEKRAAGQEEDVACSDIRGFDGIAQLHLTEHHFSYGSDSGYMIYGADVVTFEVVKTYRN